LPTRPTGEQKQKKRTDDGLPKPDNFIRYRQQLFGQSPKIFIPWIAPMPD